MIEHPPEITAVLKAHGAWLPDPLDAARYVREIQRVEAHPVEDRFWRWLIGCRPARSWLVRLTRRFFDLGGGMSPVGVVDQARQGFRLVYVYHYAYGGPVAGGYHHYQMVRRKGAPIPPPRVDNSDLNALLEQALGRLEGRSR